MASHNEDPARDSHLNRKFYPAYRSNLSPGRVTRNVEIRQGSHITQSRNTKSAGLAFKLVVKMHIHVRVCVIADSEIATLQSHPMLLIFLFLLNAARWQLQNDQITHVFRK